jgi:phage shock protein A
VFRWFVRIVRGWLGRLFSKIEDPQATLEQLMRDMQAKVPKLRMAVAQAYANKRLAEQDYKESEEELARIERQIPEAVKGGEATKQAALMLIGRKKQLQQQLQDKKMQLDITTQQAEQAQTMLNDYIHEMDAKFTEIRGLIARHKQAEVLESYAKLKQAFEIGDDSQVLDEVSRRINERVARAQGMVDVISNEPTAQLEQVRRASLKSETEVEYEEYARQLGIMASNTGGNAGDSEKTLRPTQRQTDDNSQPPTETIRR